MKNFTQKFIGLLALVFAMSFTVNAQDNSGCDLVEFVSWPTNADYGSTVSIASPNQWSFTQPGYEAIVIQGNGGQLIVEFTNLDGSYTGNGVGGYWSSVDEIASVFGRTVAPNILPRLESNEFVFNHVGPYYVTTSSPNPIPSVTPDLLQSNAALTACIEVGDPAACEDAASQLNFSGDPNELMMNGELFTCVNYGDDFMCEMVIAEYFNESCSSVQSISIDFTQADVDAAYADGVASVEVPVCEEVATQNMPLDLPQGWSMFGYTCIDSVDAMVGFSSISDKIEIVKDEWGLSYLPSWEFNAIGSLHFSEGYQIKMIEEVTDFQFCEAIVPEDGIGQSDVDAAYAYGAASVDITSDNQAVFDEGAGSVTPEDGISQADLDALAESYEGYTAPLDLQIGDLHAGGIVFQINENGSGLLAAMEDSGVYTWGQAVTQASNYSSEGYTGWHLPSLEELELMYNTIGQAADNSGNFEDAWYWSSSEYNGSAAWAVGFGSGTTYDGDYKYFSYRVRVIRAF